MSTGNGISIEIGVAGRGPHARKWFWACIALLVFSLVGAAAIVIWTWLQIPTNEELVAAFELAGGQADITSLTDDEIRIEGIVIDADVPRDVWRRMVVLGEPIRMTIQGRRLNGTDWKAICASTRLMDLRVLDCRFDKSVDFAGPPTTLESLSFGTTDEHGDPFNEAQLTTLINGLSSIPNLQTLGIIHSQMSDHHIQKLVVEAPQLEVLGVDGSVLSVESFQRLRELDHLKSMTIHELPQSAVPILAGYPGLTTIGIAESLMDVDECLKAFDGIASLEYLWLANSILDSDDEVALEAAGIGCRIEPEYAFLYRLTPEL